MKIGKKPLVKATILEFISYDTEIYLLIVLMDLINNKIVKKIKNAKLVAQMRVQRSPLQLAAINWFLMVELFRQISFS